MKFFVSLVPDPQSTAINEPTQEFYGIMGDYVTRQLSSGKVIATGAMEPVQQATVVAPVDHRARVVDGPYTEAKELVAGWALIEAGSRQEAIDSAADFIQLHIDHWPGWNGHGKVQEVYE